MDDDEDNPTYYDPAMFPPHCWRCKTTVGVTFEPDPYALEIYDDHRPCWMCDDCRGERGEEI